MQIILLLPLLKLPFPAPIRVLFSVLDKIFKFEFIDVGSLILDNVLGKQTNDGVKMEERFEMEGFETENVLRNMGSTAVYMFGFIAMDAVMIIISRISKMAGIE